MTTDGPLDSAPEEPVGERGWARIGGGHVMLLVLSVISLFPIYWLLATSLRRPGDVYDQSPLPWPMTLENYVYAWHAIPLGQMLLNTFVVALLTTAAQLLIALFAAYAFGTWRFAGSNLLFLLFVGTWLVPFQVTMMPNYVLLSQLGMLNTLGGVVIPQMCSAMAVLLLRQHMASFPRELLDAARMDGRGSWGTLWVVVVPNLRPALAALGILLFISSWNDYFWPALVLQRTNSVVQLGVRSFLGAEGDNWGAVMAASGVACLPIFAVYLLLQRHVINAFVRSGLR